jgi:hypothetical protein
MHMIAFFFENVSGANQLLRATVQTSNMNHMMLIQGDVRRSGRGI